MASLVACIQPSLSHAFHLIDHLYITQLAIQEFNECYPGSFDRDSATQIAQASLGEDVNLFRKWTEFAHYYRPGVKLDMYRKDSLDRIQSIEIALIRPTPEEDSPYTLAGHLIHHLQDAAVPSHVVPVAHGFQDGFESYSLPNEDFHDPTFRSRCYEIRKGVEHHVRGFDRLLDQTGLETLLSIRQTIPLKINHFPFPSTWAVFWQESHLPGQFGQYGILGNSFGSTQIPFGAFQAQMEERDYRQFKKKQARLAIESSKKALFLLKKFFL